jgi:predicted Zn-dependent peptidase
VVVGVDAPSRNDDERHAISIVDHVVGGGMSSRMFQAIREERGLAYSVYSYRLGFTHAGAFAVYAGTSPAQLGQVLELIHDGLNEMAVKGINQAELDAARSFLRGSLALGLEDSGARMSRLGHSQLVHGRVLEVEEIDARLAELDADGINEVAARWLSSPRTIAAVGPFDDEAALG